MKGTALLEELVGDHWLDAVDFGVDQVKTGDDQFEECQVMRFRLDGTVYSAVEDPRDGFRSCMHDLAVGDTPMANVFFPARVVGRHRTQGECGNSDDMLELIDSVTGGLVIEVGTENSDDYYPRYVASFHPENMAINVK